MAKGGQVPFPGRTPYAIHHAPGDANTGPIAPISKVRISLLCLFWRTDPDDAAAKLPVITRPQFLHTRHGISSPKGL